MPATDVRALPSRPPTPPARPYVREGLLLLGFIAVLVLSLFTVVLPELSREPDGATPGRQPAAQPDDKAKAPAPSP